MDAAGAERAASPPFGAEQLLEHAEFLRRLARGLVRDDEHAADLVQETLTTALERPPRDASRLRGWLARVLHHGATNALRQRTRREDRERRAARPESQEQGPDEALMRLELQRLVVEALVALPPDQRRALYLRYYEGLPARAIAERTGAPLKTVKTRLARGLAALRGRLDRTVDGGREAWTVALAPLAFAPRPSGESGGPDGGLSPAEGAAAPTGAAGTAILGGLLVNKLAAGIVAALAVLGSWGALELGGRPARGPAGWPDGAARSAAPAALVAPAEKGLAARAAPVVSAPRSSAEPAAEVAAEQEAGTASSALALELRWHDGTPAAGVVALFSCWDDPAPRRREYERTADAAGRLRFSGVPPGRGSVTVDRGYGRQVELAEGKTAELVWSLPRGLDVRGVVRDAEGSPVAGAELWLRRAWEWPRGVRCGRSAADGSFVLRCLHPSIGLGARAPGLLPSSWLTAQVLPAAPDDAEVRLAELWLGVAGASLAGRVLDPDGRPVPDARVHAGSSGGHPVDDRSGVRGASASPLPVFTDAEGRFVLPGAFEPLQTPVHAQAEGHPTWEGVADLRAGDVDDFEIRLVPGATVEGRVVDAEGRPVAGSRVVCARQRNGGWYEHAFPPLAIDADDGGRFRMELVPPGWQELNASAADPRLGRAQGEVDCAAGQKVEVELVLSPEPVIAGRVVDGAGNPLEGWNVEVEPVDHGSWPPRRDRSDATGSFLLTNVGQMPNQVSVSRPQSWSRVRTVPAWPGQRDLVVVVEADGRATGSLRGVVRDELGAVPAGTLLVRYAEEDPLRGALIEVDPRTGAFEEQEVFTGRHRLNLEVGGVHQVVLVTDWFTVEEGALTDLGELRIEPPGRVELVGAAVEGRPLSLEELEGLYPLLRGAGHASEQLSVQGGRLVAERVMPGTWELHLSTGSHQAREELVVVSNQTTRVDLELQRVYRVALEFSYAEPEWYALDVEATDEEGRRLTWNRWSRAQLEARPEPGLRLELPAGPATLELRTDTGLTARARVEVGPGRPRAPVPLHLAR